MSEASEDHVRNQENIKFMHYTLYQTGFDGLHKAFLEQPEEQHEYVLELLDEMISQLQDFRNTLTDEHVNIDDILEMITKE